MRVWWGPPIRQRTSCPASEPLWCCPVPTGALVSAPSTVHTRIAARAAVALQVFLSTSSLDLFPDSCGAEGGIQLPASAFEAASYEVSLRVESITTAHCDAYIRTPSLALLATAHHFMGCRTPRGKAFLRT